MNELDLYRYVDGNDLEYHMINPNTHEEDVVLFIGVDDIAFWYKLLGYGNSIFCDGIKCTMKDGYVCFLMKEICEHFDIDINRVFDFRT